MTIPFSVEQIAEGDSIELKFSGAINEDFIYDELVQNKFSKYIFDLNKVSLLNSCGIREWVKFLKELGDNVSLTYRNCPQMVVLQMNMVKGFLTENATVESFYAPYFNEDDDEEVKILLNTSEIIDGKAPEKKSDSGSVLEFDGVEETYFRFLK